jgi:hypothetical protein
MTVWVRNTFKPHARGTRIGPGRVPVGAQPTYAGGNRRAPSSKVPA